MPAHLTSFGESVRQLRKQLARPKDKMAYAMDLCPAELEEIELGLANISLEHVEAAIAYFCQQSDDMEEEEETGNWTETAETLRLSAAATPMLDGFQLIMRRIDSYGYSTDVVLKQIEDQLGVSINEGKMTGAGMDYFHTGAWSIINKEYGNMFHEHVADVTSAYFADGRISGSEELVGTSGMKFAGAPITPLGSVIGMLLRRYEILLVEASDWMAITPSELSGLKFGKTVPTLEMVKNLIAAISSLEGAVGPDEENQLFNYAGYVTP